MTANSYAQIAKDGAEQMLQILVLTALGPVDKIKIL
jgi:hypothetical protein